MKMFIKNKKGFTLIELLVVVAIISLLSSIVFSSLKDARVKGVNATVKENMMTIRGQAELQLSIKGCYTNDTALCSTVVLIVPGACPVGGGQPTMFSQAKIAEAIKATTKVSGGLISCAGTALGTKWAMVAHLKTTGKAWCVDSNGASREVSIANQSQSTLNAKINGTVCASS